MARTFSSQEVRRITGVSQRNLDYWNERQVVSPSKQVASGKGTVRQYSFNDLVRIRVLKRLRDAGISLQQIQQALKKIRGCSPDSDPLLDKVLVADGPRVALIEEGKAIDALSNGQLLFGIALGPLHQEMREKVIKLNTRDDRSARRSTHQVG